MILKFSGESPLYNCTQLSCFRDAIKGRIKNLIESGVHFLSLEDINLDIEHFRMALNDDIHHVLCTMSKRYLLRKQLVVVVLYYRNSNRF